MNRAFAFLSAIVAVGIVIHLGSHSRAEQPKAATALARPTIVVVNSAKVWGEFRKVKDRVAQLNEKRAAMSSELIKWRAEHKVTKDIDQNTLSAKEKNAVEKKLIDLTRQIEDRDREIAKALNDDTVIIITDLYNELKSVVDKLAEKNGYQLVFTYPDGGTPEERALPTSKEAKLKPMAALPFYVAPQSDITAAVIAALNEQFPPVRAPKVPPEL
jgi:Skp family chaperone for outer membrane proteins